MSKKIDETKNNELPETSETKTVTHDEYVALDVKSAVAAALRQMNVNEVVLGCSILEKRIIEGKEKKDSQGNPTGEKWPDGYSVELSFEGGKFGVRVDKMTFNLLEIGSSRYLAKGVLETKVNEYGFSVPGVKITSFERLF